MSRTVKFETDKNIVDYSPEDMAQLRKPIGKARFKKVVPDTIVKHAYSSEESESESSESPQPKGILKNPIAKRTKKQIVSSSSEEESQSESESPKKKRVIKFDGKHPIKPHKDYDKKADGKDRIKCQVCGTIFTRSCRTGHNRTRRHQTYLQLNTKLFNWLTATNLPLDD